MLWLNLSMALMGLLTLWFTYHLLLLHTSRRWALLLTLVFGLSYEMFHHSMAQLSDVPFMLLVTAGLWCLVRGREGSVGFLAGGALLLVGSCWIRILGIPIALAAAVGVLAECRREDRWRVATISAFLVIGVTLTAGWLYARDRVVQEMAAPETYATTVAKMSEGSPWQRLVRPLSNIYSGGPGLSQLLTGQRMAPPMALVLFWVPVLLGGYYCFRQRHFVLLFAVTGYLVAIVLAKPPLARYFLPIGPALLLFLTWGIRLTFNKSTSSYLRVRWLRNSGTAFATTTVVLLALCNLPKDLRDIIRQRRIDYWPRAEERDVVRAAEYLKTRDEGDVRFVMGRHAMVVAYLSGADCLRIEKSDARKSLPAPQIRDYLRQEGVNHLVLWKPPERDRAIYKIIQKSLTDWDDYALVFDQGNIQIFERNIDLSSLTPVASELSNHLRPEDRTTSRPVMDRLIKDSAKKN